MLSTVRRSALNLVVRSSAKRFSTEASDVSESPKIPDAPPALPVAIGELQQSLKITDVGLDDLRTAYIKTTPADDPFVADLYPLHARFDPNTGNLVPSCFTTLSLTEEEEREIWSETQIAKDKADRIRAKRTYAFSHEQYYGSTTVSSFYEHPLDAAVRIDYCKDQGLPLPRVPVIQPGRMIDASYTQQRLHAHRLLALLNFVERERKKQAIKDRIKYVDLYKIEIPEPKFKDPLLDGVKEHAELIRKLLYHMDWPWEDKAKAIKATVPVITKQIKQFRNWQQHRKNFENAKVQTDLLSTKPKRKSLMEEAAEKARKK